MEDTISFFPVRVISNEKIHPDSETFELELEWPRSKYPQPGQFIRFKIGDVIMPRPISVAYNNRLMSRSIVLYVKVAGKITKLISELKEQDLVEIQGPLGKPFALDPRGRVGYILVGGGTGYAPLLLMAQQLDIMGQFMYILVGVTNAADFSGKHFRKLNCALEVITEKDGFATNLLERRIKFIRENKNLKEFNYIIIACGPQPMLQKVVEIAEKNNMECFISMEERMACGVGSCKGCPVPLKNGEMIRLCQMGPVLKGSDINWQKYEKMEASISIPTRNLVSIPHNDRFSVTLLGKEGRSLFLRYSFMNASKGVSLEALEKGLDISCFGAIIPESITLKSREGNPPPRILEIPYGMMNAIALQNKGVKAFIKEDLPRWKAYEIPLIISIAGNTPEEFAEVALEIVSLRDPLIAALEINISCPNNRQVNKEIFAVDPTETYNVLCPVRKVAPDMFLIAKLSPAASNIVSIGKAVVDAGFDAISAINTLPGADVDPYTCETRIFSGTGGISGPAIRHVAQRVISQLYQADLGVPLIGIGGIDGAEPAFKMSLYGANAFQACTGFYPNPNLATDIITGLPKFLDYHGVKNLQEMVGKAKI